MKAIAFHEHGNLDVLKYADLPEPEPGPGEVLVRLHSAALNHVDLFVRAGWPGIRLKYPHILGADGAGVIASLGPGVTGWETGERVVINANISCGKCEYCLAGQDNRCLEWNLLGETLPGTYAEYVVVPALNLMRIPAGFGENEAAAASLVFLTAWHSLVTRGNLQPAQNVLVIGASGGVNTASILIARYLHAKIYVIGSNADKLARAEALGADVLIDRSQVEDWSREVYLASDKRGMDVVVDNVGSTLPQSIRTARKGGRILIVGNTAGPQVAIDNRYIFSRHLSLLGSTMGTKADFRTVMQLVFAGQLSPMIDQVFPLAEARLAQARLEAGDQFGKIVLSIP
jgi:NADPH:quinone reductase-like Zn-dependent oxidoreductase